MKFEVILECGILYLFMSENESTLKYTFNLNIDNIDLIISLLIGNDPYKNIIYIQHDLMFVFDIQTEYSELTFTAYPNKEERERIMNELIKLENLLFAYKENFIDSDDIPELSELINLYNISNEAKKKLSEYFLFLKSSSNKSVNLKNDEIIIDIIRNILDSLDSDYVILLKDIIMEIENIVN